MSLQQVLEVVTLHHVFWQIESRRAPLRERKHCKFFRSQCQDEIAFLKREIEAAAMRPAPDGVPQKPSERLSTKRPPTIKSRGPSMPDAAAGKASTNAGPFYEWYCIEVSPSQRERKRKLDQRMTTQEAGIWTAANPGKRLERVPNSGKGHTGAAG